MKNTINRHFVLVDENNLQHNHKERLSFWLTDRFYLFKGDVSVDNYLAIQKDGRQFYPFAMCREANSDNYVNETPTAYYLTSDDARAIVEFIDSELSGDNS